MFRKALLLAVIVTLAGIPGNAQFALRPVTGVVTDKRGNTLSGAAVQLENTVTLVVRSCITGQDGSYRFNELSDDIDYTLKAKYRNYWSGQKTLSKFDTSKHPEVDLIVPID